MKYGITLPYGDARIVADLAKDAEAAGWDGIFVGDAIWCIDPMIQLAASAMTTTTIKLGTMVLAVPLRIPWHLASESNAIDHLSGGRMILGLGTGATWMGWQAFPDVPTDIHTRAEMLDETIDILTELYQRKQFDYDGKHYHLKLTQLDTMHYPPQPIQQPRIPLWVVGAWPRQKSMQRILKADGLLPMKMNAEGKFEDVQPADLREMKAFIDANRVLTTPFDYVIEGKTAGLSKQEAADKLCPWAEAGMTWWIESAWGIEADELRGIIHQGPPRV